MENSCTVLFREHYSRLYTLAFRMTGNREDAEDVLQTSFLNVHRSLEDFRNQSSPYTWLYRIVHNTASRYNRKTGKLRVTVIARDEGITEEEVYARINSFGMVEDQVLTDLTRETCLQMFMNCMPPRYRAVYTLRVMLNFSVSETAFILELSESAVKVNLHRAKKIAQSHFQGRCSLIYPGAPCDCRSFACYLVENGKTDRLLDIKAVAVREQKAAAEFREEMKEILEVQKLYRTALTPPEFPDFLESIKQLKQTGNLKILGS